MRENRTEGTVNIVNN